MIEQVAKEHQQTLAPLVDELELFNSGLDSLSLAVIVVAARGRIDGGSVQRLGRYRGSQDSW